MALWPRGWVVAAAVVVIAARFYALFIIAHDGFHRRLMKRAWVNDLFTDVCILGSIGAITRLNSKNHLLHHRHLATEADPDRHKYGCFNKATPRQLIGYLTGVTSFFRSMRHAFLRRGRPSTVPTRASQTTATAADAASTAEVATPTAGDSSADAGPTNTLLANVPHNEAQDANDWNAGALPQSAASADSSPASASVANESPAEISPAEISPRDAAPAIGAPSADGYRLRDVAILVIWQTGLIGGLTYVFGWWGYPLLWFVPVYGAFLLDNLRSFCEHSHPEADASADRHRLITYRSHPLERWLLAPMNMNFHTVHHLWPSIPYYRLPEADRLIRQHPAAASLHWRGWYLAYLWRYYRRLPLVECQPTTRAERATAHDRTNRPLPRRPK